MNISYIEKNIVKLAEYKIKDTLLTLIYDISDENWTKAEYTLPPAVENIKKRIEKAYTDFENVLDSNKRDEYEKELAAIKAEIERCALNINKYTLYNDRIGEKLLNAYKRESVKDFDENTPLNNRGVADTVREYLSVLPENTEGKFSMGELISVLPLRMTRERYADYVRKGARLLIEDLPDDFAKACIERLKDMFYAECSESFKEDFPLMYEKIRITAEGIKDIQKDELIEAVEDIDGNNDALESVYAVMGMLFNDVVYLQILSLYAVDEDFLFNGDMVLKDLYYSLRDMIVSGDESFKDDIFTRTENEIEDRFEENRDLNEKINKEIQSMSDTEYDKLNEGTKVALNVLNSINEMFYSELDEYIMSWNKDNKSIDECIEGLIDYIDKTTENMTNCDKKALKQHFLKNIPCSMSKEEFAEYCSYALDGINEREASLVAYGDIFQITDEAAKEINEHEHHHHHHHHHHGNECSCGHHH